MHLIIFFQEQRKNLHRRINIIGKTFGHLSEDDEVSDGAAVIFRQKYLAWRHVVSL